MNSDFKFEKACRCCLSEHVQMSNLLQHSFKAENGETVKLLEGFKKCSGIIPDLGSIEAMSSICEPCEKKLVISYDFRELCLLSHQRIEENSKMVKLELHSEEEDKEINSPTKHDKPTKRKRSGRYPKKSDEPVIIYMKEEPFELVKTTNREEMEMIASDTDDGDDGDGLKADSGDADSSTEADDEKKDRAVYQCYHCDTFQTSYGGLNKHKNSAHPEEVLQQIKRKCPLCHNETQNYTKHLRHIHKDFKPNQCKLCNAGYLSQAKLHLHMRIHKTEQTHPYKCLSSDCDKSFATENSLRDHVKIYKHLQTDKYRCPRCGLDFAEFLPLHSHFKAKHDLQNVKKLFPCYKCKEICLFRRYILEHDCAETDQKKRKCLKKGDRKTKVEKQEVPSENLNFPCPKCDERFENEDALTCHRYSICLDDPKFVCVTCGMECATQKRLTTHKRTHKDMSDICEDCGFQAIDRNALTKHRLCHTTERPAKCDICSAAFKNSNILRVHKQTHGVRQYECALCGHKFKSLRNLRLHMNALHIRPASTYRHECKFCGKMCARNRDLVAHIRGHTGEVSKCHICDRSFRRTSTLNNHIRTVHDGQNLKCVYCNLTFSMKARLKQHLFIHRGFMPFNCSHCSQKFVRKYRFAKHLQTHNVEFNEAIHGYQETEDVNAIIAGSLPNPARVGSSEIEKAEGFSLNYQM